MAKYSVEGATLSGIADAIRAKTGSSAAMTPAKMADEIASIDTLAQATADATAEASDIMSGETAYVKGQKVTGSHVCKTVGDLTADATAAAGDILSGKTAYVNGIKVNGSMTNQGAVNASVNPGSSYTIPAGYHNGSGKVAGGMQGSRVTMTFASQSRINANSAGIHQQSSWSVNTAVQEGDIILLDNGLVYIVVNKNSTYYFLFFNKNDSYIQLYSDTAGYAGTLYRTGLNLV